MSIFIVCGHIRMIEFPIHPHEDVDLCDAMVMIQTADILINAGVPPQQRAARPGQHYSTLLIAAFLF